MLTNKIILIHSTAGWQLLKCECLDWLQMLQYIAHQSLDICGCPLPPGIDRETNMPINGYPPIQEKGTFVYFTFQPYRLSRRIIISCCGNGNVAVFTFPASLKQVSILRETHRVPPGLLRDSLGEQNWKRSKLSPWQTRCWILPSCIIHVSRSSIHNFPVYYTEKDSLTPCKLTLFTLAKRPQGIQEQPYISFRLFTFILWIINLVLVNFRSLKWKRLQIGSFCLTPLCQLITYSYPLTGKKHHPYTPTLPNATYLSISGRQPYTWDSLWPGEKLKAFCLKHWQVNKPNVIQY